MKLLACSLSLRQESFNRRLLKLAIQDAKQAGAEIEILELKDYPLPAYDGDIEAQKIPDLVTALAERIKASQGLIISSPEYNFSYPGHFKNTFDWVSRIQPMPWYRKSVLLMSASVSLVGGNRSLWHLRVPFEACGAFVFPDMFSLASAQDAFQADGQLKDATAAKRLNSTVVSFIKHTEKLAF